MKLSFDSISISTTYTEAQFLELSTNDQYHLYNQLLAQQLALYIQNQNSKPTLQNASFNDTFKLLKLFNSRLVQLGLEHGNLFELVMDDYRSDFDLLLKNPYFINNHSLSKPEVANKLKEEHLFYREGDFMYRNAMVDRFALSDFLDLVDHFHIGLVPNMIPLNALKQIYELKYESGVVYLVRNNTINQIEKYPIDSDQQEFSLEKYKGWARFNIGKIAFIMPYPTYISLEAYDVAPNHFRKDCAQYKRYLELIEKLKTDWEILKSNNEITLCRVMVDLLSIRASTYIKSLKSDDQNLKSLSEEEIRSFLVERKERFKCLDLPVYCQQEYFEWGDLNANLRWLFKFKNDYFNLNHSQRIDLIESIESAQITPDEVLRKLA